jgi:LmbE family N-acetylglucosaminyl deacetylase
MHLFLSPHYDDAVLSCGATIHQLVAAGRTVIVVTVMGGKPEANRVPDTPLVRELHARWKEGADPVAARMSEDEAALGMLGAQAHRLVVWMDCIYRTSRSGQALYPTVDSIFSGETPQDDPAAKLLPTVVLPLASSATVVYAPMGVGSHVDHRIVRDWALELRNQNPSIALKFYEEYPYCQDQAAVEKAAAFFSSHEPELHVQPEAVTVSEADTAAKVKAIACYQSQISSFWSSVEAMEAAVRKVMRQADGGTMVECYWLLMDH